jgi:hypothetical protein
VRELTAVCIFIELLLVDVATFCELVVCVWESVDVLTANLIEGLSIMLFFVTVSLVLIIGSVANGSVLVGSRWFPTSV